MGAAAAPRRCSGVRLKPLAGFLARFLLIFLLLEAPWPGLDRAYAASFRAAGNLVFGRLSPTTSVRFIERAAFSPADMPPGAQLPPECRTADTIVELRSRPNAAAWAVAWRPMGPAAIGYAPTAFLLALIAATPLSGARRWRALVGGLLLVNLYVCARVLLALVWAFSGHTPFALFMPGPLAWRALDTATDVLVTSFAGCYAVPVAIWLLVAVQRSDWIDAAVDAVD